MPKVTKLKIGDFVLDPSRNLLTGEGREAALEPKIVDVLMALVAEPGAVLSRDALIDAVWKTEFGGDERLTRAISHLRRAFGDERGAPRYIETVAKRGYRLVAAVRDASAAAESAHTPTAPVLGGTRATIVVLPFVNMSSNPEHDHVADSITEDVTTDLARWQSLAVLARNSAFRFKGQAVDVVRFGREVGAQFLVEGSVRPTDGRIKISAQLIETQTGHHIWAERYSRSVADLHATQEEVVNKIVSILGGRVLAVAAEQVRRKPWSSLNAYDLTLRGNSLPWTDPASAAEAKASFERAIELDPGYARPHSILAIMLANEWAQDLSAAKAKLDSALALALRGVELAEGESTSHANLGLIYLYRRDFDLAIQSMERAVEINPTNQGHQMDLGLLVSYAGRADVGLERMERARRLDPYAATPPRVRFLGTIYFMVRRYRQALELLEQGQADKLQRFYHTHLAFMAACCARLGQVERARELMHRWMQVQPSGTVEKFLTRIPHKRSRDSQHLGESLRLAGMPN